MVIVPVQKLDIMTYDGNQTLQPKVSNLKIYELRSFLCKKERELLSVILNI
jgi:hypothetical protein